MMSSMKRFLSQVLTIMLTIGLLPMVGLVSNGKASGAFIPSCSVTESVYAAVYQPTTGTEICISTDYADGGIDLIKIDPTAPAEASYDLTFHESSYKGQPIRIVNGSMQEISQPGTIVDPDSGVASFTNVWISNQELLYAVIGITGDKVVPIGYFGTEWVLVEANSRELQGTPTLKSVQGQFMDEPLSVMQPAAGIYYVKVPRNMPENRYTAVMESMSNGTKQYFVSEVYWGGETYLEQYVFSIPFDPSSGSFYWSKGTSSFAIPNVTGITALHHRFYTGNDNGYWIDIADQTLADYNQNVEYWFRSMGVFLQTIEVDTATSRYMLSGPFVASYNMGDPPFEAVRIEGNPYLMKQVNFCTNFCTLNEGVSPEIDLTFDSQWHVYWGDGYETIQVPTRMDRNKELFYPQAWLMEELSYSIIAGDHTYKFTRGEFLKEQLNGSSNVLYLGTKIDTFDIIPDSYSGNGTFEYYPKLRTQYGDILDVEGLELGLDFEVNTSLQMSFNTPLSLDKYDAGDYRVTLRTNGTLDNAIFDTSSSGTLFDGSTYDIPIVHLEVSVLDELTGLPISEPFDSPVYVSRGDNETLSFSPVQGGIVHIRGFGYGSWKVKTVSNESGTVNMGQGLIQANDATLDGNDFNKATDSNPVLKVIKLKRPDSYGEALQIADLVRFTFTRANVPPYDFNQDGRSDSGDLQYLMTLIQPFGSVPK